ncbi:salicylate synthase [Rhodococcus sp. NPDC060090]|uniref:salicylate synthase n=1 Tax=Rhodococcus sp. NPDC060090 TaxID=3347056 RepID=UPI0036691018
MSSTTAGLEDFVGSARSAEREMLDRDLVRVIALVETGLFDDYVVYENRGKWVFATGITGSVALTSESVTTTWEGQVSVSTWSGSPATALQRACEAFSTTRWNAFGWVGFEFAAYTHGVRTGRFDGDTTLAYLFVPRIEITWGHSDGNDVVVTGGTATERAAIFDALRTDSVDDVPSFGDLDIFEDSERYRARTAEAIDEICRGEYAKVILSRTIPIPFEVDLPRTYRLGRLANTPARSFLLDAGGIEAAGFSPELVVSVDDRRMVSAEPLAGTRAFGVGAEEDSAARNDLEKDPKEIAEHAVSVRAAFHEVASVSEDDSAMVTDFMSVRERGSVQHLASTVRGRLRAGMSPWDAFAAVFPAVTASGIPKRESIDAIVRLEDSERALYSGAVVRTSSDGTLEAALVLRAVYQQQGHAWLRAGAGIVAQSTPDREFDETCEKLTSVAPYLVCRSDPRDTCARDSER